MVSIINKMKRENRLRWLDVVGRKDLEAVRSKREMCVEGKEIKMKTEKVIVCVKWEGSYKWNRWEWLGWVEIDNYDGEMEESMKTLRINEVSIIGTTYLCVFFFIGFTT